MKGKFLTILLVLILTSCFNREEFCKEETQRIFNLQCKFEVTKVTNKNKRTTITGVDSLGNEQEFYYRNATVMDHFVKPGMILSKDSGNTIFQLQKNRRVTTIKWDCLTYGEIVGQEIIDTISQK